MNGMPSPGDRAPGKPAPASNLALACAAEAVGTLMLVLVGTAVATAAALGKSTAGPAYNSLAFGLILIPIVGALGRLSGAHVNPAVTLGLAVAGRFPWRDFPAYCVAQLVGAVVAALVVWAAYGHGAYFDSHLGAPAPVNGADSLQVLLVEALIAFILVFTVLSVTADAATPPGVAAVSIGFALAAGVLLGGSVSGGAGNPARALGPMIVTGILPLWLFYVLGPLVGGALAAITYRLVGQATSPRVPKAGEAPRLDPLPTGEH